MIVVAKVAEARHAGATAELRVQRRQKGRIKGAKAGIAWQDNHLQRGLPCGQAIIFLHENVCGLFVNTT